MELWSLCLASSPFTTPQTLWASWSLAPQALIPLAAALALYAHARRQSAIARWRIACFAAGWLVLGIALVSPLCRLAATLVSAHMLQHVLLVAVAPLLLVLGMPAWSGKWRPSAFVTAAYGLAIWLWHLPPLYAAILSDATVHTAAYALLVGVSLVFWAGVLNENIRALPALFATLLHTGVLGALLTFAPRPWYPLLGAGAPLWELTPLADQQLAGLLMWVPMAAIYLAVALALAAGYFAREARVSASRPA